MSQEQDRPFTRNLMTVLVARAVVGIACGVLS